MENGASRDDRGSSDGSLLLGALDQISDIVFSTIAQSLAQVSGRKAQAQFLKDVSARMPTVLDEAAARLVDELFASAHAIMAGYEVLQDTYQVSDAARWAAAFDAYRMLWVACHENGEAFSARHFNVEGFEPAPILHAQVGLQARACRVALEVFVLLRSGLGAGALARARTLHEIAVISAILAKHGASDGDHPDLAERYL